MEDKWDAFVPFTSIVKIDITEIAHETIPSLVKRFKSHNIELVAEKIETYEEFHKFKEMGFDYFQEPNGKIWWTLVTGAPVAAASQRLSAGVGTAVGGFDLSRMDAAIGN